MARVSSGSNAFTIAAQRTKEATQKLIVNVAKREHAKIMGASPRPAAFERFVDGRKGAVEETVKASGVILYQYSRLDIVAKFAMETLYRLSPVGPPERGHYRDAHTLFLNGAAVTNLKGIKSGDRVEISNPMPYSRKIEVGSMKMRVPGHVYERATRIVRAKYGSIAVIGFTYRSMGGKQRHPVMTIAER
jgi:hypothetical protein